MAGCKCDHGTVIVDPGGPIPCDDCLYVTSHVVSCDDGVGPCGETGTKVIETNCTDPTFTVIYYDSAFENVSISQIEGAWTITYDTVEGEAVANSYYEIRYKVGCGGGDLMDYLSSDPLLSVSEIFAKMLYAMAMRFVILATEAADLPILI